jgi:hypothetical protein
MPKNKEDIVAKVQKIIDIHPTIRNDMSYGLINARKLAKYIIKQYLADASLDAVIGAIRRYNPNSATWIFENAQEIILHSTTMSTRNPIVSIDMNKDQKIQQLLPQLFSLIHYQRGEILRIFQAEESIKILIDQNNLKKIQTIIPKNKIKEITTNLAEIHIHMDAQAKYTPGTTAVFVNALAMNNINIRELMTCGSEEMWYVEENDLPTAYRVFYQTIHPTPFKFKSSTALPPKKKRGRHSPSRSLSSVRTNNEKIISRTER